MLELVMTEQARQGLDCWTSSGLYMLISAKRNAAHLPLIVIVLGFPWLQHAGMSNGRCDEADDFHRKQYSEATISSQG